MGLFEPAWKNRKLDWRVQKHSWKISDSVKRIKDEAELVTVFYTSPHWSARVEALKRFPKEKVLKLAMDKFPEDFYDSLKDQQNDRNLIFLNILDTFQKLRIAGQLQDRAKGYTTSDEGMNALKLLSTESENPEIREAASERYSRCLELVDFGRKFAEMSDEERIIDFLHRVEINNVYKKSNLFEDLDRRNAKTVVRPGTFRKIIKDQSIDVHVREFIAGYEGYYIGKKNQIENLIKELKEGETKGNQFHPVTTALYKRATVMSYDD